MSAKTSEIAAMIARLHNPVREIPEDAFDDHPITRAVISELRGMIDISHSELAWIVEATLWQLRRLALNNAVVDLDYLGEIKRQVEIECDAAGSRTTQHFIWDGVAAEEVTLFEEASDV